MGAIPDAAKAALEGVGEWTAANIDAALEPLPEQMDLKKRVLFQAVRVAVCGNMVEPRWARPWRSSAATTAWRASTAPARWRCSSCVNVCIRSLVHYTERGSVVCPMLSERDVDRGGGLLIILSHPFQLFGCMAGTGGASKSAAPAARPEQV